VHRRTASILLAAGLLALVGALAHSSGAEGAPVAGASCTPATNIEAIIDDSGSMLSTDSNRLRVQAMDLLINAVDDKTTLGAIEFGSSFESATPAADVVFPAEPVGPNAAAMKSALDTQIQGDAGGTDYNSAFETGRAANPGAQARIFLTDGGHNAGTYNDTHLNPPPQAQTPTYVVGFSAGLTLPEDQARLAKIASDTGGVYFPLPDSSALQSVMNQIESQLSCQRPPRQFTDELGQGQSKSHSVAIGASTKAVQITLTWTSPLDKFKVSGLRLVGKHGPIAVAPRPKKLRKLKVSEATSTTFTLLKVSHLTKGTLHFRVKAAVVGSGAPKVTLTTQVGQSTHR
jgi:hypothetical protein